MKSLCALVLLAFASPNLGAAMLQYQVTGDWSGLAGPGLITFSLSTMGTPNNNVTAVISDLSFTGGSYDFGVASPAVDVVRSGSTITFGGSSTARFYDISAAAFGSGISFVLTLSGPDVGGSGSGDGWTFNAFASEDNPGVGFEYLMLSIPSSGPPVVDPFSTMTATPINGAVPEPGSLALMSAGLAALILKYRKRGGT